MTKDGISFMNAYHSQDDDENSIADTDYRRILQGPIKEHAIDNYRIYETDTRETANNKTLLYVGKNKKQFESSNLTITDADYKNMVGYDTLSDAEDMLHNRFTRFSRYGYLDPTHELVTGTREYLFFSKPDLHLINTSSSGEMYSLLKFSPFFDEAFKRYKLSYYALQQTFNVTGTRIYDGLVIDHNTKYIPLLSNMVTSTLDLPDVTAGEVSNNQNLYQINTSYREGSIASDLQYDFSLEFKDTKYLDVYMLFKIYDEYFRMKYMAEIMPTKMEYIFNKIYPEAMSVWKVIVDDTGRIIYWAKATGCTPMSVPRGSISNIEGNIKFTVNWKAQFVRDMDPVNLLELNYLTAKSLGIGRSKIQNFVNPVQDRFNATMKINDVDVENINFNGPTWVGYPMVIMDSETNPLRTGHATTDTAKVGFHRLVWVNKKLI